MHFRISGAGRLFLVALGGWLALANASAAIKDIPFLQDVSIKFQTAATLSNATLRRLEFDRNGVAYVLTDRGVARTFDAVLTLDRSFRPLTGLVARDMTLGGGELFYLFDDRWLSNGDNGDWLLRDGEAVLFFRYYKY